MNLSNSPLRLLVKSYANGLLERKQYLKIRKELLKKLATHGSINSDDLSNFLKLQQETEDQMETGSNRYSFSDWVIIILGLMAAVALAFVLYG